MKNKLWIVVAALAVAIVVLVGVAVAMLAGDDSTDLSNDPRGQEACDQLIQAIKYDGDTEVKVGSLLAAGEAAAKARTQAIRDTATPLAEGVDELDGFALVDADALAEACEDAGVEIPDR